jgi:hypothetical protein
MAGSVVLDEGTTFSLSSSNSFTTYLLLDDW